MGNAEPFHRGPQAAGVVFLRCPSPRRAAVALESVATIVGFQPWCFGVSWTRMPSVKEMHAMHALALTVPNARMIFRRKGVAFINKGLGRAKWLALNHCDCCSLNTTYVSKYDNKSIWSNVLIDGFIYRAKYFVNSPRLYLRLGYTVKQAGRIIKPRIRSYARSHLGCYQAS